MDSQMEELKRCVMDCAKFLEDGDLYAEQKHYSVLCILYKYDSSYEDTVNKEQQCYLDIFRIVSDALLGELVERNKKERYEKSFIGKVNRWIAKWKR